MKNLDAKWYAGIFFILFYLYFFFVYDASLYAHYQQPMFLFSSEFLKEFTVYPGGVLDWLSHFIFQFFAWNWAGSLILSVLSFSIFILMYRIIQQSGTVHSPIFWTAVPFIFLLVLLNMYNAPFVIALRFLTVLCLFTVYVDSGRFKPVFILLIWPIYLLLGGWTFLFYCLIVVIHELIHGRGKGRFVMATLHIMTGVLYPKIAARFIYMITLREAYTYLFPNEFRFPPYRFESGPVPAALFSAIPVILLLTKIYDKFIRDKITLRIPFNTVLQMNAIRFALIGVVCAAILHVTDDGENKTKIAIDRYAYQGRWAEVIDASKALSAYDLFVNFQVNRALYFQGQLLDSLFNVPQILGTDGLFIHRLIASQVAIPTSDLLYDLAHVSGAQTMAYEGQTKMQYNPRLLKRLVMTNLINREPLAAMKFVRLLKQSLVHRKWAERAEDLVIHPPLADADPEIRAKRALKPTEDFFLNKNHPNSDLAQLLEQHPENRMAFEYLMAFYLLDGRLMNLYTVLDRFSKYGYARLPYHVQEAILLLKTLSPDRVDIEPIQFDSEVLRRFRAFNLILTQNMRDPVQAEAALRENFEDSYWFYIRYVTPRKTHTTLKARKIDVK